MQKTALNLFSRPETSLTGIAIIRHYSPSPLSHHLPPQNSLLHLHTKPPAAAGAAAAPLLHLLQFVSISKSPNQKLQPPISSL
ncbi:hypothetical protein Pyn_01540 [Prunus yedoensis var. nudiflora]|uniref:Uncharacterized protein n=1 Tax=Prunus yedoensis var. nudiflora TaxID=2094558 RepID=A0A314Z008_PRUYE|nr:hypothetical protein Pyn_01540 [Prunus yedoensis var. nudiflora]